MVRIIDYKVRMNTEGEPFNALIVQGGIQLVKSQETGFYYATWLFRSDHASLFGQTVPL